jgi:hypothetical protein
MIQKGDYLETLFRPGDCAAAYRNLLKYLKKLMVEAAGVEPTSQKSFFSYIQIVRGLLGDLLAKILNFI